MKYQPRPPLWSSGQSLWLQIQRSRVRFPALPDFLSSSGSRTGSTQPREVNWGATWIKKCSGPGPENRLTAVGIRCADHVTPFYPQKLALTSPTGGGHSVGIVRSRTKATEFFLISTQGHGTHFFFTLTRSQVHGRNCYKIISIITTTTTLSITRSTCQQVVTPDTCLKHYWLVVLIVTLQVDITSYLI